MNMRYGNFLHKNVPEIDIHDIGTNRQFEPEYTQQIYINMLTEEYAVGDYLSSNN